MVGGQGIAPGVASSSKLRSKSLSLPQIPENSVDEVADGLANEIVSCPTRP